MTPEQAVISKGRMDLEIKSSTLKECGSDAAQSPHVKRLSITLVADVTDGSAQITADSILYLAWLVIAGSLTLTCVSSSQTTAFGES